LDPAQALGELLGGAGRAGGQFDGLPDPLGHLKVFHILGDVVQAAQ
jgi:hypothetical protein